MQIISENDLTAMAPDCCRIGFASIGSYKGAEREQICSILPAAKTVIVIAHHIQDSLEWTWMKFPMARGGATSPADIHCLSIAERVECKLSLHGYQSRIIPYPGVSGPMFKTLAIPTGLGALGDNFLFMNEQWGPWIHLQVYLLMRLYRLRSGN